MKKPTDKSLTQAVNIRKEADAIVSALQELVKKFLRKSEKNQTELLECLKILDERYVRSRRTKAILSTIFDIMHEEINQTPRQSPKSCEMSALPTADLDADILDAEFLEFVEKPDLSAKCTECGKTEHGSERFLKAQGWKIKGAKICLECNLL